MAVTLFGCVFDKGRKNIPSSTYEPQRVQALNQLKNEINNLYGFREGVPRINLGPCGPFAKTFREQWNSRFKVKVNIAFVMVRDAGGESCAHVVVKLPDGTYFDGGNGVIQEKSLLLQFPGSRVEVMNFFDLQILEKNSYGLKRNYPECPNYSPAATTMLIEKCLDSLHEDPEHQP